MIWRYWATRHLIEELIRIDPDLYSDLEEIIPSLRGEEFDPTELSSKENLVRILMSFTDSTYFEKKDNMRRCLERLPPLVQSGLVRALIDNGYFVKGTSFEDTTEKILKMKWNFRNIGFCRVFQEVFELPNHFLPPEKKSASPFVDIYPLSTENNLIINRPFKNLLDFQVQVYSDAMKKMNVDRSRFVMQMPTGSGKTRTTMEVISNHLKSHPEGSIVIWMAHTEELCEQSFECFIEVWQHLANKPLKAVRFWGKQPLPSAYDKSMFIVGGFSKIMAALRKDPRAFDHLSDRIGLIVIDEAHRAVAPRTKEAIISLAGDNTHVIGLTATPGRTDYDETEEMAEFFFESKVNITTDTGESEIKMLKRRGVLAEIDYIPIESPLDIQLTASQKRYLEEKFDFPPGLLKTVASSNVRNIEIMKKLLYSCQEIDKRILFFSCSVKHSRFIMALLQYHGIGAVHVDGNTSRSRREDSIRRFKDGDIQVLCNYGVLTTGFDAPNTDEVFISRPTQSVVLYSQMVGRGLRGPTIGGTPRCRIVEVRDNITGFAPDQTRVYEWFEEFWDN
jgi:superfamily II DNA or RNA helicase